MGYTCILIIFSDFYKKLIETEAQIRNIKKGVYSTNPETYLDVHKYDPLISNNYNLNRNKRSVKRLKKYNKTKRYEKAFERREANKENSHINDGLINPISKLNQVDKDSNRYKRLDNGSFTLNKDKPVGIVIEKQKYFLQFDKPSVHNSRILPKCSHAPKDFSSHEHQMKHPFYKNTGRFDELLDKYFDRNLPEIIAKQLGLDFYFNKDGNTNVPNKHTKDDRIKTIKSNYNYHSAKDNDDFYFNDDINNAVNVMTVTRKINSFVNEENKLNNKDNIDKIDVNLAFNEGSDKITKENHGLSSLTTKPYILKTSDYELAVPIST